MNTIAKLSIVAIVLLALAMPVLAQEDTPIPPSLAELGLPAVLTTLVGVNFKLTDWFKRMLGSTKFGGVPHQDVQGVLAIGFSMILGIGMVYGTPDATAWVLEHFPNTNLIVAHILTGLFVSTLGGFVADVWKRVKAPAAPSTVTTSGDGTTNITVMPPAPEKLEAVG